MYHHSLAGSLSPRSSEIHANGRRSAGLARHWATSVVLPKPAGASTRISLAVGIGQGPDERRALDPARAQSRRIELGLNGHVETGAACLPDVHRPQRTLRPRYFSRKSPRATFFPHGASNAITFN